MEDGLSDQSVTQSTTQTTIPVVTKGSLQTFSLDDLAVFTREGEFNPKDSPDFRTFYVGRDDVGGILRHLLSRVSVSFKLSMFGFADETLANMIVGLIQDQHVFAQISLDKTQAGGVGERKILDSMPDAIRSSFAIGTSSTGQILHTKGAVLDGIVAFEGSTNWSASGEGVGIGLHGENNATGYKAQSNTLVVYVNQAEINKFSTRLDEEHLSILQRQAVMRATPGTAKVPISVHEGE